MTIAVLQPQIASTFAVDHAPFWRAPSNRFAPVHHVEYVHIIWRGQDAAFGSPRLVVSLVCRSLPPHRGTERGLLNISSGRRCEKCELRLARRNAA